LSLNQKIAITGNIGSGKSTVCRIFETMKVPVYNSDIRAMILTHIEPQIISVYKQIFGKDIYKYGFLDRKKCAATLFNNRELLKKVEEVVFPAIIKDFETWCEEYEHQTLLFESALLFESKMSKMFDQIIFVSAPEALRIQRVMKRDNISSQEVQNRIDNQWKEKEKIGLCDYVIVNDDIKPVIPQILGFVGTNFQKKFFDSTTIH